MPVQSQNLKLPASGLWNGFNEHINVVECSNAGENEASLKLTIKDNQATTLKILPFRIAALGTVHLILNEIPITNSYGMYVLSDAAPNKKSSSKVNCLSVLYRMSQTGSLEYAFTLPVQNPMRGITAGLYNSMNPEGKGLPVFNWLSVYNPGTKAFHGRVLMNNQDGSSNEKKSFNIKNLLPGERRDFALGHDKGERVGLYRILPNDLEQPYGAFVTRYSRTTLTEFNFAFPLYPIPGSCDSGPIPASTMDPAINWGEIANSHSNSIEALIEVRSANGGLLHKERRTIEPYSQYHLYLNDYIGERNTGSFRVKCAEGQNHDTGLLTQSLFYGIDSKNSGEVKWAYASQSQPELPKDEFMLTLPLNTFLHSANWVKFLNVSSGRSTDLKLSIHTPYSAAQDSTPLPFSSQLSPRSGLDIGLHEKIGPDNTGLVLVSSTSGSAPYRSELLRVYLSPSGLIDYIMNVSPFVIATPSVADSCRTDIECDDRLFCNGVETCGRLGRCRKGVAPCQGNSPFCSEETDRCVNSICGDGQITGSEACDSANLNGQTCSTHGHTGGTLTCANDCLSYNQTECTNPPSALCGDGKITGSEVCDSTNLNGQTCSTYGYTGGTLTCANDCLSYNQTACSNPPTPWINHGMLIESVSGDGNSVTVRTTAATYVVKRTEMEMWRRIDPATNAVKPRLVAKLQFDRDLGTLTTSSFDVSTVMIESPVAEIKFSSDSLFFVNAKSYFSYTHQSLIQAPWNKQQSGNRIWTDGYGGSLHVIATGTPAYNALTDETTFTMSPGTSVAHMVFPPKPFDFEGLYGNTSRPFVQFVYSEADIDSVTSQLNTYIADRFGVIVIFADLYESTDTDPHTPELLKSGVMGYAYQNETKLNQFISLAHANGFKVITYAYWPESWRYPVGHQLAGQLQNISTTLQFMRDFQWRHNLDGWYFDNADAGKFMDSYNFIRQVRADIGDAGVIYHHDSVDVVGGWSGFKAVMIDAYVDYALVGETGPLAEIHEPNNPYLRYYSSGYGLSQTYGAHKIINNGRMAILDDELRRVFGENLHAVARNRDSTWTSHFQPGHEVRRSEYLLGRMKSDVDWPVNERTGWFRRPLQMLVTYPNASTTRVRWQTSVASTTELTWTSNGIWWPREGFSYDDTLRTSHDITLPNLPSAYEFRIRSKTDDPAPSQIIWGYIFGKDTDKDSLPDDWEIKYFGNLLRNATDNPDGDALTNLVEFQGNTNPTIPDR